VATPTYKHRLRLEGAVLGGCGAIGSLVLLTSVPGSRDSPLSTIGQLAVVVVLLVWLGPRSVRRSVAGSELLPASELGSGEPTPLWHIAAIVLVLTAVVGEVAGWSAGLRVTGGCLLVGIVQALVLASQVSRTQHRAGVTYYRVKGSRILRGTRLARVSTPVGVDRLRASTGP
jgi:hypothetical protein